jgi:hypothetical protein
MNNSDQSNLVRRLATQTLLWLAITGALLAAPLLSSVPSNAAPKIALGTLSCKGRGNVGLILGSKEVMHCIFTTLGGMHYPYMATITKVGLDIGYKNSSTFLWTVLGPTIEIPDEALSGSYGGLTAGISIGVGGNANALVGGFGKSIFLQPLSVEGQTGFNLSAGVAGLILEPS